MKVVVDASVAIKWFVREPGHEQALALLAPGVERHAPDLVIAETASIAWKKRTIGEITIDQAEAVVSALPGYFSSLLPAGKIVRRALEIGLQLNHPIYDCLYLACAATFEGGIVVTADDRLLTACRGAGWKGSIRHLDTLGNDGR